MPCLRGLSWFLDWTTPVCNNNKYDRFVKLASPRMPLFCSYQRHRKHRIYLSRSTIETDRVNVNYLSFLYCSTLLSLISRSFLCGSSSADDFNNTVLHLLTSCSELLSHSTAALISSFSSFCPSTDLLNTTVSLRIIGSGSYISHKQSILNLRATVN